MTASTGALNDVDSAADGHLSPSACVDDVGRLHVFWNGHHNEDQYAYWRGTAPGDITMTLATTMGGITGNALPAGLPADLSYPKLILKADGLVLCARQGVGGAGTQGLWEFDSSAGTWAEVDDAFIAPVGHSPYMMHVHVNPVTDVVHFAFTVAEGQTIPDYRDVYYCVGERTGGAGNAWTFRALAGGSSVSLPITDHADYLALTTGLNRGVQVLQGLSSTDADVPLICVYYAKDGTVHGGGSNRYLVTRSGGAWVRNLMHEVHPTWDLIDAVGGGDDPSAVNSEYGQVGPGDVRFDAATGAVTVLYRSNYELGSDSVPCIMKTTSTAAPYDVWSTPSIFIDMPVGDYSPVCDDNAWNHFGKISLMVSLLDVADQWPGGAASSVYVADVRSF